MKETARKTAYPKENLVKRAEFSSRKRRNDPMKQNPYPIESVEIYYNRKTEAFDKFLASLLHDYLSTDNFSPDREDAAPTTKKASTSP